MHVCPDCGRVRIFPGGMRMMRKRDGKNYEETWGRIFDPECRGTSPGYDEDAWADDDITYVCKNTVCPECEAKART